MAGSPSPTDFAAIERNFVGPHAPPGGWLETEHTYTIADGPKMLRETLCAAQGVVNRHIPDFDRRQEHSDRLQRLIAECDRKRPLGPDGKHGNRHTPECGCDG